MHDDQRSRRTVESSIRTALVWEAVSRAANERREQLGRPLSVLDLGGGSGGFAVPLAEDGHDVVVVDPSPDALASLGRRAGEAGVADRVHGYQGDAATLPGPVTAKVDLVCCHGVLEYVDDAAATLAAVREVLADDGILSLLVAQRIAAVLSRALAGQFEAANAVLLSEDGRWGESDPMPRRFDADTILDLLDEAGLTSTSMQGVRVFSDLVPSAYLDTEADRDQLLALERAITEHDELLGRLGAGLHVIAVRD
ncbi:MAG: methyltransferase domain-containing protein [Mobilicoccus sp.]|nr:methyltransferase domain-containing protein [Mobilicoccus sp.]